MDMFKTVRMFNFIEIIKLLIVCRVTQKMEPYRQCSLLLFKTSSLRPFLSYVNDNS